MPKPVTFYSEGVKLAGDVFLPLVPPQESEAMYARAGEPKKLVVLKGVGHYEVYGDAPFGRVMDETLAWYRTQLPAR